MLCDWLKGKTPFKRRFYFKRRLKRHKKIRFENDTKTPFWTNKSALPLYHLFQIWNNYDRDNGTKNILVMFCK